VQEIYIEYYTVCTVSGSMVTGWEGYPEHHLECDPTLHHWVGYWTITGPPRSSQDCVWTVVRGIELPCEYVLRGAKQDRSPVRTALRQAQTEQKSRKRKRTEWTLVVVIVLRTVLYYCVFNCVVINPMNTITHATAAAKMCNFQIKWPVIILPSLR